MRLLQRAALLEVVKFTQIIRKHQKNQGKEGIPICFFNKVSLLLILKVAACSRINAFAGVFAPITFKRIFKGDDTLKEATIIFQEFPVVYESKDHRTFLTFRT